MFCGRCGTQNPDNVAFCKACGNRFVENSRVRATPDARQTVNTQRTGVKKRRPVLTTRKTNTGYVVAQILLGDGLFFCLALYFFARGNELMGSYWNRSDGEALLTGGYIFMLFAVLGIVYHAMVSRTYADLYPNRIVGSGMQGIQTKSFNLRFDQIVGISVSQGFLNLEANPGAFLIVNTSAGDYKIITTKARANEMVEYYNNITQCARSYREM